MKDLTDVVFVVEDDPALRAALASLIRSVGMKVETFDSASQFLSSKRQDAYCCLVLDVRLPGLSGLDLQHALAEAGERIPIVFMTGHGDIPMTVRAMKAGAVEFLAKPFRDQDLLDAIRQALDRGRVMGHYSAEIGAIRAKSRTLTDRERQVMAGIVSGRRNKQIAADLGITELTIKVHRRRVMQKMAAASLAALVRMVERIS